MDNAALARLKAKDAENLETRRDEHAVPSLVERLNARIEYLFDHSQCGKPDHILLTEAAAALEAKDAEIAKLKAEVAELNGCLDAEFPPLRQPFVSNNVAENCIYEARHDHFAGGSGSTRAWCQIHGWNCPNLARASLK